MLADGGLLAADVPGRQGTPHRRVRSAGPLKLPLESLAGIVFHPPADRPSATACWIASSVPRGETDRLLLDNGDEVTGLVERIADDTHPAIKAEAGRLTVATAAHRGRGLQSGLAAAARAGRSPRRGSA